MGAFGIDRDRRVVELGSGALCLAVFAIALVVAQPVCAAEPTPSITQFTHTRWSAIDGLPGPVRAIAQTPDGYLWLGTEVGLYRFDGLRFEAARGADPQRGVLSLLASRDGALWIGFASGGVGRLREGKLTAFPPGSGIPVGGILSIAEDAVGSVWIAGPYGFARFQNGGWRPVGAEMGYAAPAAQSIVVDGEGTVWVATDRFDFGLSQDGVRKNTILALARNATHFSTTGEPVGYIGSMSAASDGSVWIVDTTNRQVRRVDPARRDSDIISVDREPISLAFGIDGSVWVGLLEDGLRRTTRIGRRVPLERFSARDLLSGNSVHAALRDREGNLWFGTSGGLDRFRENKMMAFSETEGLSPDRLIALASTPDGSVWLFGYTTDIIYRFVDGALKRTQLDRYSRSDSTRILAMHANANGNLWLGGSFKLAKESHGTFRYFDVPDRTPPSSVEAVAEDNTGQLWVTMTSSSGAVGQIVRRRGAEWTDVRANSSLPRYRCRVLHPDAAGRMWMGFENGEVAVFDGDTSRLYSTTDGLPGGRVLTIVDDREARIWVGSQTGLSRFERDHFVTLTQDNGLPGSSISAIVEDDEGNFWLAGALGILRVERTEMERALASTSPRIRGLIFDAADGLRGLPRQREPFPTAARAADGRLWFATSGGVASIDPHHWPRNAVPPPVRIEKVIADDHEQDTSGRLSLSPRTRNVEIHFAALSLTAPDRVRYRYRLEGYDPDWRPAVRERTATYTNLPPRNYRFQVIASNNDGVWNETGATLDFAIVPAFYQTRLFLLICAGAASCLIWGIFRWRMRRVEKLRQLQADLAHLNRVTTMGQLTASLAHEVNQPIAAAVTNANTCVRWLTSVNPNVEEARDAASRMVQQAKRAAEIIRRTRLLFKKGTPRRELVKINELIDEIIALLRNEAGRYGVALRSELKADLPEVMGDRIQLQQVLVNLMMNSVEAMKDVEGTRQLTLITEREGTDQVQVSVSDTGVGLPPEVSRIFDPFFTTKSDGTGMGLVISRTIIDSHGGQLWATPNSGRGASFHFTLPTLARAAGS
jgi:signal transduction histidine kinase/ligand-binding sensor domain-containing protein